MKRSKGEEGDAGKDARAGFTVDARKENREKG